MTTKWTSLKTNTYSVFDGHYEYMPIFFYDIDYNKECQDAVEGRARFARPNIPRPSKAIGEYSE